MNQIKTQLEDPTVSDSQASEPDPGLPKQSLGAPLTTGDTEVTAGSLPGIIRVLVVQENENCFQNLRHLLPPTHSCDFEFQQAQSFEMAQKRVDHSNWDVIFVDICLPSLNPDSILEKIVHFAETFPLIVLTPMDHEHFAREAIKRGAQDYIIYEAAAPQILHRTIWAAMDRFNLNQELLEKTKQVERAFWQKHQFLSTLSHEIKTPMNGIRGGMQLLREDTVEAEQLESIDMIDGAIDQLMILIDNLLEHGKAESGKVSIRRKPTQITKLVEALNCTFKMSCEVKGLKLDFKIAPGLPKTLLIDELRVRQILSNLIGNAIKFTQHGSVQVGIESRDDEFLYFFVKDSGRGISKEKQQAIFYPYDQGDNSLEAQSQGTGLGLAICKEYAEAMGGKIQVSSTLGEGSVFGFTVRTRD